MNTTLLPITSLHSVEHARTPIRQWAGAVLLACARPLLAQADCMNGARKASTSESHAKAFSQQARDLQKAHDDAVRPQTDELTRRRDAIPLVGQEAAVRLHMNLAKLSNASNAVPNGIYGAPTPTLSAHFKVQNVTWSVGGSDTPLRQALADALDKTRLQGLVDKSPPGVEESEAFAQNTAGTAILKGAIQ